MGYKKKRKSGLVSDALGIVGGSVVLGVGSQVLGGVGGIAGVHGQQALAGMSGFLPVTGKVVGAGHAVKYLKKLKV